MVQNPFNGIEREEWMTVWLQYISVKNPFNGIERRSQSAVLDSMNLVCESIQWNWKQFWGGVLLALLRRPCRIHSMELKGWVGAHARRAGRPPGNPFNGIERARPLYTTLCCLASWNPFNGIESRLERATDHHPTSMLEGIHSMELKDLDYACDCLWFQQHESIQWNWKAFHGQSLPELYQPTLNPFNGIER